MKTQKKGANKPVIKETVVRGLTWRDLPGACGMAMRLNLALMKRGKYPPDTWRVPTDLEGPALALMLEERAKACSQRKAYRASEPLKKK